MVIVGLKGKHIRKGNIYFSIWFCAMKSINTYLRLKICLVWREVLACKYVFIDFASLKFDLYII